MDQQSKGTSFSSGKCCDFMLSIRTMNALISDVPRMVSIDVNACHANVIYNARDKRCALDYLRNKIRM